MQKQTQDWDLIPGQTQKIIRRLRMWLITFILIALFMLIAMIIKSQMYNRQIEAASAKIQFLEAINLGQNDESKAIEIEELVKIESQNCAQ